MMYNIISYLYSKIEVPRNIISNMVSKICNLLQEYTEIMFIFLKSQSGEIEMDRKYIVFLSKFETILS